MFLLVFRTYFTVKNLVAFYNVYTLKKLFKFDES